jgi:hypothetical protein
MSSPQAIDGSKLVAQIDHLLLEADREKHRKAAAEAQSKQHEAVAGTDAGFLTTDAAAQLGRPLTRSVLIERLSKMNPNLVFEQSKNYPHIGAIYVLDPTANLDDPDERCRGRRHIVGMEWTGISPEFTTRKVELDEWGNPQMKGQIRGWRTVLVRLIHEKLIGAAAAERVFSISRGRASQRWYEEIN